MWITRDLLYLERYYFFYLLQLREYFNCLKLGNVALFSVFQMALSGFTSSYKSIYLRPLAILVTKLLAVPLFCMVCHPDIFRMFVNPTIPIFQIWLMGVLFDYFGNVAVTVSRFMIYFKPVIIFERVSSEFIRVVDTFNDTRHLHVLMCFCLMHYCTVEVFKCLSEAMSNSLQSGSIDGHQALRSCPPMTPS